MFRNIFKISVLAIICNAMTVVTVNAQDINNSKSIETKIDKIISSLTIRGKSSNVSCTI